MNKVSKAFKFAWKNAKVWMIVSAAVMVILLTATLVVTQNAFLSNTVSIVLGAERMVLRSGDSGKYVRYGKTVEDDFAQYKPSVTEFGSKDEVLAEADKFNEEIVSEGIVLLKNDGQTLPFLPDVKKISVFGKNSVNLVLGGSGSSDGAAGGGTYSIN